MAAMTSNAGSTVVNILKGALAGAVGVWALDQVTELIYERQDKKALKKEQKARPGGKDPAHVMAGKIASLIGKKDYRVHQPSPLGIGAHYALGILPAALFAAYRGKGGLSLKRAAAYGMGLFVLHDELFNWALGLSGPPTAYPWQAHARGLAGHLGYGAATEGTLAAIDRIQRRSEPPRISEVMRA